MLQRSDVVDDRRSRLERDARDFLLRAVRDKWP